MGILNQWMGIADLASEHGEVVDQLLEFVHWFMLVLGLGWAIYIAIAIYKFRQSKNPRGNHYGIRGHATTHIEIGVIITEAVLLLGFAYPLWSRRVDDFPTGENVVRIRAVGEQFRWWFHYCGPDGKFGRVDPQLTTSTNPIGLDAADPNGKDDFTDLNTLTIPLAKKVIIGVTAKDVIHNLALVPMRIAQDAIPGTEAHMWFTAQKVGSWDIVCGQLCGSGHGVMAAKLEVKSPTEFDSWYKEKTPAPAAAATPAAQQAALIAPVPAIAGN
jgi:cytochrome c oxidase subunit II